MDDVSGEVWLLLGAAVVLNAVVAWVISVWSEDRAYKRGYNSGMSNTEMIALGRLMERASIDAEIAREIGKPRRGPRPHIQE